MPNARGLGAWGLVLSIAVVVILVVAAPAIASPPPHAEERQSMPLGESDGAVRSGGSARGVAEEWMVLPEGYALSFEMRMLTAEPALGDTALAFTDVALLTTRIKASLSGKLELFGAVDMLPKQPSYTDELIWQGASLGVRGQPGKRPVALWGQAAVGPMLADLGYWTGGGVGVEWRKRIHQILTFDVSGGGGAAILLPEQGEAAWLAEASVSGSALFRDPSGHSGAWLGLGYALPIVHHGRDPVSGEFLDPQPRLDLHLGGVVSMVDAWDLYVDYAIIDRGDLPAMATRLPILDGGFDQRQIIFGITYHQSSRSHAGSPLIID